MKKSTKHSALTVISLIASYSEIIEWFLCSPNNAQFVQHLFLQSKQTISKDLEWSRHIFYFYLCAFFFSISILNYCSLNDSLTDFSYFIFTVFSYFNTDFSYFNGDSHKFTGGASLTFDYKSLNKAKFFGKSYALLITKETCFLSTLINKFFVFTYLLDI